MRHRSLYYKGLTLEGQAPTKEEVKADSWRWPIALVALVVGYLIGSLAKM